jgi:hypothetical protein
VEADCNKWQSSLRDEAGLMQHVMDQLRRYMQQRDACAGQKWKLPPCGQPISLFGKEAGAAAITNPADEGEVQGRSMIRPEDDSKSLHLNRQFNNIYAKFLCSHLPGILRRPHVLHATLPNVRHG